MVKHVAPTERDLFFFWAINISLLTERKQFGPVGFNCLGNHGPGITPAGITPAGITRFASLRRSEMFIVKYPKYFSLQRSDMSLVQQLKHDAPTERDLFFF